MFQRLSPAQIIGVAALLAAVLAAVLALARAEARPNLVQNIAVVFFATVVIAQAFRSAPRAPCSVATSPRPRLELPLAAGAIVYSPVLSLYFVSDDFVHLNIARMPFLQNLWAQFTQGQVISTGYHLFFRPLGFASLALDYRLFHDVAAGYHLVNLALHLGVVAGVLFLCSYLDLDAPTTIAAASLFAVLPITIQPVAYIAARFDLLATGLALWAMVLYMRYRKFADWRSYVAALGLFLLATAAKESAYALPLILLALELLVMVQRRWAPLLGFFAVAGGMFFYRFRVLHGIGGYQTADGEPAALQLGRKSLAAVLVRGPAETLLAYDWLQPRAWDLIALAAVTGALAIILGVVSRPARPRLVWFSLCWILLAILPAHSILWHPDPGLLWSRAVYFSSIGLALLLAVLLAGMPSPLLRKTWTALLFLCFAVGLLHNLSAWTTNSRLTRQFLGQLQRIAPAPPPRSEFVFRDLPLQVRGVRFFLRGLPEAVQQRYGRADLGARRSTEPPSISDPHEIELQWTGQWPDLVQTAR